MKEKTNETLVFVYDLSLSNKNERERNKTKRKFYYRLNQLLKEGKGFFITESVFSISPTLKKQVIQLFEETEGAVAFMIEAKNTKAINQ